MLTPAWVLVGTLSGIHMQMLKTFNPHTGECLSKRMFSEMGWIFTISELLEATAQYPDDSLSSGTSSDEDENGGEGKDDGDPENPRPGPSSGSGKKTKKKRARTEQTEEARKRRREEREARDREDWMIDKRCSRYLIY